MNKARNEMSRPSKTVPGKSSAAEQEAEAAVASAIGVVIVTHGALASVLKENAESIVGEFPQCEAIHIDQNVDVDKARAAIGKAIGKVDGGQGVLLLTDMLGGTPCNISLSFLEQRHIEVVTGVNLPMLLKLPFILDKLGLREAAGFVRDYGKKTITVAGDMLDMEEPAD